MRIICLEQDPFVHVRTSTIALHEAFELLGLKDSEDYGTGLVVEFYLDSYSFDSGLEQDNSRG